MFTDTFPDPSSPWFLPFFALGWLTVTGVIATLSGWSSLATQFRATQAIQGERFRFASASLGGRWLPVSYGNCLFVTVAPTGLSLSILFPFRLLSPPLFFPWSKVESVTEGRFLFMRFTLVRVVGHWSQIKVYGRLGKQILEAYKSVSSKNAL
jgi:hypothetical protein